MSKKKPPPKTSKKRVKPPSTSEEPTNGANPAGTAVPRLVPIGSNELIVRMYRQGLGDCFLLALPAANEKPKYVLIDCGVHCRQTDGPARLGQVLAHLIASTGSHLDVVVATHEHADHLSGFVQKGSPFLKDDLTIGELWLAWTEERGNPQADALRARRGTAQEVIDKAVEEAKQRAGATGLGVARRVEELTDFDRPAEDSVDTDAVIGYMAKFKRVPVDMSVSQLPYDDRPGPGVAKTTKKKPKRPTSNELALTLLTLKAGEDRTRYCEPGTVQTVAGVSGLRAYVLGPPRSDLLEKDKPTKIRGARADDDGGAYKEVYLTVGQVNRALELSPRLNVDVSVSGGAAPDDWRYPFAASFRRTCELSATRGVGKGRCWSRHALPPPSTRQLVDGTYLDPKVAWRRIDGDWLGAAETLAVNLVGDTNNSSLVLAFEWGAPDRGVVLLFPADAQVGNWLSWRDQPYGHHRLSADSLMSRVLLYKVGHHGSHNATVRRDPRDTSSEDDPLGVPFGLELMNDIIAMIPVDYDAAKKEMPDPWKMPHEPLYRRLRERARRRILRSDLQLTPLDPRRDEADLVPTGTQWEAVPGLQGVRWRRSKEEFTNGTKGPLCYDISITLRD